MTSTFGSFDSSALGARVRSSVDQSAFGVGVTTGPLLVGTSVGVYVFDGDVFTEIGSETNCGPVAEFGGLYYYGRSVTSGTAAATVRSWNGSAWSDAGSGLPSTARVRPRSLAAHGGSLYALVESATSLDLYVLSTAGGTWSLAASTSGSGSGATFGALSSDGTNLTQYGANVAFPDPPQPDIPVQITDWTGAAWTPQCASITALAADGNTWEVQRPFSGINVGGGRFVVACNVANAFSQQEPSGAGLQDVYLYQTSASSISASTVTAVGGDPGLTAQASTSTADQVFDVTNAAGTWWISGRDSGSATAVRVKELTGGSWALRENAGNPLETGTTGFAFLHYHPTTGHVYAGVGSAFTLDSVDHFVVRWNGSAWEAPSASTQIPAAVGGMCTLSA